MASMPEGNESDDRIKAGARRGQFKQGIDADDARRKREDEAFAVRKNDKAQLLMKRRQQIAQQDPNGIGAQAPGMEDANQGGNMLTGGTAGTTLKFGMDTPLPQLAKAIFDDSNANDQLEAVFIVRKLKKNTLT